MYNNSFCIYAWFLFIHTMTKNNSWYFDSSNAYVDNLFYTGNRFNNWFNGVELNPRWGLFDLKYVCFRSGIIGWILMNFINISKAFDNGDRPSVTLLIVAGFQLLYVADYFWFEDGILVSRDIVHEHLGYNLLVQFLMIPFCFAVQTRYLMMTKYELPWYCLLAVSILNCKIYISIITCN